eukprot:scaffold20281_cov100-Skeletonema_dohrnii-CCMP3373.AAC.1
MDDRLATSDHMEIDVELGALMVCTCCWYEDGDMKRSSVGKSRGYARLFHFHDSLCYQRH